MRTFSILAAGLLALTFGMGCGDDDKPKPDTTDTADTTDTSPDTTGETTEETTEETSEDTTAPDGEIVEPTYATLTFSIDDSANKTYDATDGLAWKGSFSYDAANDVLSFSSAWSGPFVNLWDDGPAPDGHEAPGATAGDNIWTVAVRTPTPEADQVFEYGAIRGSVDGSDGGWIWTGPNGTVTVPAGETGVVAASGLVIPAHGTIDLRLTIDISNEGANLDPTFQGVTYTDVKVKGSAWGWTEIAMADDGQGSDEAAGDGIYTYVMSEHLGKHDGLLKPGDEPMFVFVLDGSEYKAGGAPPTAGVTAAVGSPGAWEAVTVENKPDGDQNTFITVPEIWVAPGEGYVAVNFSIDDSANKTYEAVDGLAWKGSFAYDPATRIMTKDAAWGGPFAVLYDDGPWNEGGHEPAGATAGDNVWGITVWVSNAAADTFEYGAIRGSVDGSDGAWIWVGPNGTFAVEAGATTAIDAAGLVIAPHGTIDLRLTIDTSNEGANLNALFQGVTYNDVKVKGSAWGWSEIALADDGAKGDAAAADGIYTFVLSENIGKHDGLLKLGDMPEFIFVLDSSEYKNADGEGASEGVSAWSDYSAPGADYCVAVTEQCTTETIGLTEGQFKNTMIVVGDSDEP